MSKRKDNPWKGLVLGVVGGIAGIVAMEYYWKTATALKGEDPRAVGQRPPGTPTM